MYTTRNRNRKKKYYSGQTVRLATLFYAYIVAQKWRSMWLNDNIDGPTILRKCFSLCLPWMLSDECSSATLNFFYLFGLFLKHIYSLGHTYCIWLCYILYMFNKSIVMQQNIYQINISEVSTTKSRSIHWVWKRMCRQRRKL